MTPGRSIGYRKGERGGNWIARLQERGGRKHYHAIGPADDIDDADGISVLSFAQAQERARSWFEQKARELAGEIPVDAPLTVEQATKDYLAWFRTHRRSVGATEATINAHILPELGSVRVAELTPKRIRDWLSKLAAVSKGDADDPEAVRRRRATANRVLTVLKAALNHAWREGHVPNDAAWRKVKPFRDVDAAVIRYLTEAECVRLVNATAPDFRPLVRAALLTGCRYGELTALRASDFNPDAGTITVRTSKSGKPRHVVLTDEGKEFFAAAVTGKAGSDLIFRRPDGEAWGKSHQHRPMRAACAAAKIVPPISFHVLRHTHGSTLAMRGVPLPVIAKQLGHADTRMTERHYAHLAPSYVADTIRAAMPRLGIVEKSNVAPIKAKRRAAPSG